MGIDGDIPLCSDGLAPLSPWPAAKEEYTPGLVQELNNRTLPTALPTGTENKEKKPDPISG